MSLFSPLSATDRVKRGTSRRLVVLLHAWTTTPKSLSDVRGAVEDADPDADILAPRYPAGVFSGADPCEISAQLCRLIEDVVMTRAVSGEGYEGISLVGHSLGALLVRKAFVYARDQTQDFPGEFPPVGFTWSSLVRRFVLLAGTNRGWQIETRPKHMPRWKFIGFSLASKLHRWGRFASLIAGARRGAPFIANLRLQWVILADSATGLPPTIQLLGLKDDIVNESDNIDVECGSAFNT